MGNRHIGAMKAATIRDHRRATFEADFARLTAELERLRRAAQEHVNAWEAYFHETGGEPAAMWESFARLKRTLAERGEEAGDG